MALSVFREIMSVMSVKDNFKIVAVFIECVSERVHYMSRLLQNLFDYVVRSIKL